MKYRSTVLEANGRTTTAVLEAASENELAASLEDKGRVLIRARPVRERLPAAGRPLPPKKLLAFTQAMESLLAGGVPVLGAFDAVLTQEKDERLAAVYSGVAQRISSGETFAEALAAYPRSFPPLYRELIRAGEASGSVDQSFAYLAGFLHWIAEIRGVIKQAIVYPIVVLSATYGLILFLLAFVVPRLAAVVTGMVTELPPSSRILFGISAFVESNVGTVLGGTFALVAAFVLLVRNPAGAGLIVSGLSRLPVARGIVVALNRAQACRTISVLVSSGITVSDALRMSGRVVSLPWMRRELEAVDEQILGGVPLSTALSGRNVVPDFGLVLLKAGEESGSFDVAFGRLAELYDDEAKGSVKRAVALLEPIMTVFLGVVIAGVAIIVVNTIYGAVAGVRQ